MEQGSISFRVSPDRQLRARDLIREELANPVGCALMNSHEFETGRQRPSKQILEVSAVTRSAPGRRGALLQQGNRGCLASQLFRYDSTRSEGGPRLADPRSADAAWRQDRAMTVGQAIAQALEEEP